MAKEFRVVRDDNVMHVVTVTKVPRRFETWWVDGKGYGCALVKAATARVAAARSGCATTCARR